MEYRTLRNWKYQITKEEVCETGIIIPSDIKTDFIELLAIGKLTLGKWYAWDGATFCPDWDSIMQPSLIHDALCQLISEGFLPSSYQKDADILLKKLCIENNMNKLQAHIVYICVRSYSKVKTSK